MRLAGEVHSRIGRGASRDDRLKVLQDFKVDSGLYDPPTATSLSTAERFMSLIRR